MTAPPPLVLEFPLPRAYYGVALGNGAFGALVWGDDELHVTVSRNDHWDHRHGVVYPEGVSYRDLVALNDPMDPPKLKEAIQGHVDHGPFAPSMLPGGRFDLHLARGLHPCRAQLDYTEGLLEVSLRAADGGEGRVFFQLSPTDDCLHMADPEECLEAITPRPAWEWLGGQRPAGEYPGSSLSGRGLEAPAVFADPQSAGWFQGLPADPGLFAAALRAEGGWLVCAVLSPDAAVGAACAQAIRQAFGSRGTGAFREACRRWWEQYWARVPALAIPEDFFRRFYHYAQYKLACATSPHAGQSRH